MEKYNPKTIESKWQKFWENHPELFGAEEKSKKPKFYCLDMFPYPSGDGLHVGHVEGYTASDIYARYQRMNGKNVLHPIGWDAFGLPAENFAIKSGVHPAKSTQKNIKIFTRQIKSLGFSYDWSREIDTSSPEYYQWTQWFFLFLYKHGLAYRKKAKVNWCESCKTVLANEQVEDGICERCKNEVVQKDMEQWFFRITDFAEDLIKDLDKIDWPESTKTAQKNWIGKSEGAIVEFSIFNSQFSNKSQFQNDQNYLEVFTTRLDTIYGCTYCVVAPEHELVASLLNVKNLEEIRKYVKQAKKKTDLQRTDLQKEKTGVEIKGLKAINPFTKEAVPIFVADYVLSTYGTGAVMAVPAHDERDFEFAKKYKLGIIKTIIPQAQSSKLKAQNNISKLKVSEGAYTEDGFLVNSGKYSGLASEKAREEMAKWLEKNNLGGAKTTYKLRDWLISRQRYWGAPIPMVHCEKCAQEKEKVLILHGWEGGEKRHFMPSLKKDLEEKGYQVFAFDAPNTGAPDFEKWLNFIEAKIKKHALSNFSLVGHSMGGLLALKLAEKYKLKKLVLVTPVGAKPPEKYFHQFKDKLDGEDMALFKRYQNRKIDSRKIKANAREINFIFGLRDVWITEEIRNFYISEFKNKATFQMIKDRGHLTGKGDKRVESLENLFKNVDVSGGWQAVPEKDLPVLLPQVKDYRPKGTSPLGTNLKFVNTKCPRCGGAAKRETDTMDTFVCSSWYFFRFADPRPLRVAKRVGQAKNKKELASSARIKKWLPVDLYIGGAEHTVLHLLYSRFFTKALYKYNYINFDEPFAKLRHQGIVLAEDGRKMSKSLGNVINPDEIVREYGADVLRLYEMFMGPLEDSKSWNTKSIIGLKRFLERVWKLQEKISNFEFRISNQNRISKFKNSEIHSKFHAYRQAGKIQNSKLESLLHKTIKKVTEDIENLRFNTAISALMILLNEFEKQKQIYIIHYTLYIILLAPFAPHLAEEIWSQLGRKLVRRRGGKSIFLEKWPVYDKKLIKDEEITLVIQVNGKVRDQLKIAAGTSEAEVKKLALAREKIVRYIQGDSIRKTIFVPDRLLNFVV